VRTRKQSAETQFPELVFSGRQPARALHSGNQFEERDLLAQFGEVYRRYRAAVGMLLPRRSKL